MAYEKLLFVGGGTQTTLTADPGTSGTTISVTAATNWPSPAVGEYFYIDIDWDVTAKHEKVLVEARSGTTLTAKTSGGRGADGTTGVAHAVGAKVRLIGPAVALQEAHDAARQTRGAVTTKGDLLAATGSQALARLGVGANNTFLVADSAQTTGLKWAALDAELLALAGLTSAADKLPYFTGSGTASLADLTTFARTILDDADAATVRATLGLGTFALLSALADGAVSTTAKLADGIVTAAKLAEAARPRYTVGPFGRQSLAADETGTPIGVMAGASLSAPRVSMIEAGSIIGVSISTALARTAGTISAAVTKNGTAVGPSVTLDGSNMQYHQASQATNTDTFVAGDDLGVEITAASYAPTASNAIVVMIWCQVT